MFAISDDLTQDQVIIEYVGTSSPSGVVAFALEGFEKVLDAERNCVSSCPERTGFETAIAAGTPPVCVYCSKDLLEEFNHQDEEAGCKCIDGYYRSRD